MRIGFNNLYIDITRYYSLKLERKTIWKGFEIILKFPKSYKVISVPF